MKTFKLSNILSNDKFLIVLLGLYIFLNLFTLTKYSIVHDDEGFHARMAYLLLKQGLPLTDPNFSYVGYFHNMKFITLSGFLFYLPLTFVGWIFGFGLFQERIVSLLFSLASLVFTYKISLSIFDNHRKKATTTTILLALSSFFILSGHTIRPEAMFLSFFLSAFYFLLSYIKKKEEWRLAIAFLLSGLSLSIHPNGIWMPFLLFLIFFYQERTNILRLKVFLIMFVAWLLGSTIFFFCDYFPNRHDFWQMFFSPFLNDHTNTLTQYSIKQLLFLSLIKLKSIFWDAAYHRNMFYAFIYAASLFFCAFQTKKRPIKHIMFTVLTLHVIYIGLRFNRFYWVFFIPFYSMLLNEALFICFQKLRGFTPRLNLLVKTALNVFILAYMSFPIITLASYRNNTQETQHSLLTHKIPINANLLASSVFFFSLENKNNIFPYYTLTQYSLEKLLQDNQIKYLMTNYATEQWLPIIDGLKFDDPLKKANLTFLKTHCRLMDSINDFQPHPINPGFYSKPINLYHCP